MASDSVSCKELEQGKYDDNNNDKREKDFRQKELDQ